MKNLAVIAALIAILVCPAFPDTRVKAHTRKNGTHVQPHMRTKANRTQHDNYSSRGNVNPYTGKRGTKTPRR